MHASSLSGYEVTVLVRDPARLPAGKSVKVIVGDVLRQETVDEAVQGQDAVVVVLGTRNDLGESPYLDGC